MFQTLEWSWGESQSLLSHVTLCMSLNNTMLLFPSIREDNSFIYSTCTPFWKAGGHTKPSTMEAQGFQLLVQ